MTSPSKRYIVTLRFRYPAWDEREGITFRVLAVNKTQANKFARSDAYDAGHTVGMSIKDCTFTAVETSDDSF